jgi:hypothetical protein
MAYPLAFWRRGVAHAFIAVVLFWESPFSAGDEHFRSAPFFHAVER